MLSILCTILDGLEMFHCGKFLHQKEIEKKKWKILQEILIILKEVIQSKSIPNSRYNNLEKLLVLGKEAPAKRSIRSVGCEGGDEQLFKHIEEILDRNEFIEHRNCLLHYRITCSEVI